MLTVEDFTDGTRITVGDTEGTVQRVIRNDSAGRAFIEYRCDQADRSQGHGGCPVESVGNLHRIYQHTILRWSESGFLEKQ
jgi:hypothetical protein